MVDLLASIIYVEANGRFVKLRSFSHPHIET